MRRHSQMPQKITENVKNVLLLPQHSVNVCIKMNFHNVDFFFANNIVNIVNMRNVVITIVLS